MLDAVLQGTTDPDVLDLARGRIRAKLPALREALAGHLRRHHGFLVAQLLGYLDFLKEALAQVSAHVEEVVGPFAEALRETMLKSLQCSPSLADLHEDLDGRLTT